VVSGPLAHLKVVVPQGLIVKVGNDTLHMRYRVKNPKEGQIK
jgi:hypothetical protein